MVTYLASTKAMRVTTGMVRKIVSRQSPYYLNGKWVIPEMHLLSEVLIQWIGDLCGTYRLSFPKKSKGQVDSVRSGVEFLSEKYWQLFNEKEQIGFICVAIGLSRSFPESFIKTLEMPIR
jgi:hypothetical protein